MSQIFATSSPYPQITFAEAWQRIAQQLAPLPARDVPLAEAGNLVLARDVVAAVDVPAFAAATMDGYAVRTADAGAGDGLVVRRVTGEGLAGADAATPLLAGECRRIMTGAPLPPGADAVIPVEETSEVDGVMVSRSRPAPGTNVRAIGSDVARGAPVLPAGTLLGPAEIGLLATLGLAEAPVHPRPRVLVLATGDELVPPGQPLAPGQVYDSNSYALAEAIRQVDCLGERRQPALDDADAIESALREAVACADLVLTTGGVSMGTRDLLKPALERLGTVHFGRVATKPGKP
ncbi:MAG: gephyrin-like molybdotransferase Glp, partial [Anaerolineales bacterium]